MEAGHPAKLDSLIHSIHAAAGHQRRWEAAIAGLRGVLRGRAAVLARHDFTSGRGEWLFESPTNPAERAAYAAEHSARNPWFISSLDYRPGRVMTGEELLEARALRRTDFYRHCLKPLGLYHRLCGVVSRRDDVVYYADVLRGRSQPAFDDEDRTLFGSILRHLTVSLENHWRLVHAHGENRALRSIMDRIDSAVFVVDSGTRVLLANAQSEGLLEEFEGLELRGARIAAASRAEDRALREAIAEAATSSTTGGDARILTISNPKGLHPLVLTITPAGDGVQGGSGASRPAAVLIARNPHPTYDLDRCAFASIFELTPAQARLAGVMFAGHSLSEASRLLRVSENTVRSHLKQIYQKTHTHSQIELVHLHSRLCTEHV